MTKPLVGTFSIVARCPQSGRLGIAISTAIPAVGSMCPFIRPGVGAVTTQSWVNPYLAIDILDRLARGEAVGTALAAVLADDPDRSLRQVGVVGIEGTAAGWTGEECTPACGHLKGEGYAIQGNMLSGVETLAAMEAAFLASTSEDLAERLVSALEAGQAAGGDKRGKQSAALLIQDREAYPDLDLRVDEHAVPVAELRRVFTVARRQLQPFLASMPKRHGHATPLSEADKALILAAPAQRGDPPQGNRQAELEAVYEPIRREIEKLRSLDVTDFHPAVVFDPRIGLPRRRIADE
ncbi:MAG: DUF1028 domain-containing protein [Rhodospirillales bacterium]|nr:DUF1028 domain-containing protein [Rhodospirillales bacterium]